jgi:hypothetical protein
LTFSISSGSLAAKVSLRVYHAAVSQWSGSCFDDRTWVLAARTPEYAALEMAGFEEARRRELPMRREAAMMCEVAEAGIGIQSSEVSGEERTEAKERYWCLGQQARKK